MLCSIHTVIHKKYFDTAGWLKRKKKKKTSAERKFESPWHFFSTWRQCKLIDSFSLIIITEININPDKTIATWKNLQETILYLIIIHKAMFSFFHETRSMKYPVKITLDVSLGLFNQNKRLLPLLDKY